MILILFLLIQGVFSQNITTCQQENYLAVIGGPSYTVNSVHTAINSIATTIAVAGLLTQTESNTPLSYLYLFSSKSCQLISQNQFPDYTNGIKDIAFSPDNNQVAMVAYSADTEFLIVVETTSSNFETWIYQTGTNSDIVKTLLALSYDQYFIVGAQQIRKVFAGGNAAQVEIGEVYSSIDFNAPVIKCATVTGDKIFALIQNDDSQSIVLTKLNHQLEVLGSYSTNNQVSITQADNDARMSSAVASLTTTAVATCVHGLNGGVQFTLYFSDDTTHAVTLIKNYRTQSWAQCLGVRVKDSQNADFILIDQTPTLWWYSINFDTGTLQVRQTTTPALTGWQSDRRSSLAFGKGFILIPAVVTQILGIQNGYTLGFVRINKDAKWIAGREPEFLKHELSADPDPNLGQGAAVTQIYTSSSVNLSEVLTPTVQKLDWIKDFCPDTKTVDKGTTICRYWMMYENPKIVQQLDTKRDGVPKGKALCPPDHLDFSLALTPIRQVCFPYLKKGPKVIPYEAATDQYFVYQSNKGYYFWPTKTQKAFVKNVTAIVYQTNTDDKANFPGDSFTMTFEGQQVDNEVVKISRGQDVRHVLMTPTNAVGIQPFNLTLECLSVQCPTGLQIQNDTLVIDGSDICSRLTGVYVFSVEAYYPQLQASDFGTLTLNFTCPKPTSPISEGQPWPNWLQQSPQPTPSSQDKSEVVDPQAVQKNNATTAIVTQSVISNWTDKQVKTAVAEAKARRDKTPKTILISAKVSNQGNLRLSFSCSVALPSYLQFDSATSSLQVQQNSANDSTAQSRRRRRLKCEGGVCPALPSYEETEDPPEPIIPDCSGGDCFAAACQGDDCIAPPSKPDCSTDDCHGADCEGDDCDIVCSTEDCEDPECKGTDCIASQPPDCSTDDCADPNCQGADCEAPEAPELSFEAPQVPAAVDAKAPIDVKSNESQVGQLVKTIKEKLDCNLAKNLKAVYCGGSDPTICPFGSYFDNEIKACKEFILYFGEWKDLLKITILPDPDTDPAQSIRRLEHTYHVTAATVDYVDIQIDFVNPLQVTVRDKVEFELKLKQIEPDLLGFSRRLATEPGETMFEVQMISQLPPGDQKTLKTSVVILQEVIISAVVGSAILLILLTGDLAQIWCMVNGLQIMMYLPLLAIQFPANASMIIDKILIVANFNIPYLNMEEIFGENWQAGDDVSIFNGLPNNELLTSGFGTLGFSTRMLSRSLGSVFIFTVLSFGILGFIGVLELLQKFCNFKTVQKQNKLEQTHLTQENQQKALFHQQEENAESALNNEANQSQRDLINQNQQVFDGSRKATPNTQVSVQPKTRAFQRKSSSCGYRMLKSLKKKFLWNYFIRLSLECSLQLIIASWLGLKYGHFWNIEFAIPVTAANVICFGLSLFWFIVVTGLPIFIFSFYLYNWQKIKNESFKSEFGSAYAGLKSESKLSLVYPIFFLARRCLLLITALAAYQFIWLQIVIQLLLSFFIIVFVYTKWIFKNDTQNRLEIMNEGTTVVLLYIVYMFSDLIPDPETQYVAGYVYIVMLISNLLVHLVLIGVTIFVELVKKIKGWVRASKNKKIISQVGLVEITPEGINKSRGKKIVTPQTNTYNKLAEVQRAAENRYLEAQKEKRQRILKKEDRNFLYLKRQFQTDENFDFTQGMCCGWLRNSQGVRAIIFIDMILCFNLVRFIFALRAYRNMEDHFMTYVNVRLFTFFIQTLWLLLNLAVTIYLNVWQDSTLGNGYVIGAILVVIVVTAVDLHFMQCVLFLNNHMERLNYKAGEDEENVSYAYQMDPTAPENIEEQKEDAKLKKQRSEIRNQAIQGDATVRQENLTVIPVQQGGIEVSCHSSSEDSKWEVDSQIKSKQEKSVTSIIGQEIHQEDGNGRIVEQEWQDKSTFQQVRWYGTKIENEDVISEIVSEIQSKPSNETFAVTLNTGNIQYGDSKQRIVEYSDQEEDNLNSVRALTNNFFAEQGTGLLRNDFLRKSCFDDQEEI